MKENLGNRDQVWNPPKTIEELYKSSPKNIFSHLNRPTAGQRFEEDLPRGDHDFQLYSLATPNGQKVGIMLEELEINYDAHTIVIGNQKQFGSGFVKINPNSKIPAATDRLANGKVIRLFESGAILIYLAEKYNKFIPSMSEPEERAECLSWVNWAQVQAFVTGNYGHFFVYAPESEVGARNYGVNRYGMEVQRLCSVLDQHLKGRKYMVGDNYTIADIAVFPWFELIRSVGYVHEGTGITTRDFLNTSQYLDLNRWADTVLSRVNVQRGMLVCRKKDSPKLWLTDSRYSHLRTKREFVGTAKY